MKYFCYIFSLYFLALNLMPCTDVHDLNILVGNEFASISKDNHSNCPQEEKQDFCSPFCGCSVCGQVIIATKLVKWIIQPPIIHNFYVESSFYYSKDWQSEYQKTIFKPPQEV